MIDRFLTFYYMPGEETLFRNIRKLEPGHFLLVKNGRATVRRSWDLDFTTVEEGFDEAAAQVEAMFEESVRLHMISDVPVGFLLSGGVDSAAVLSYAVGKTDRKLSSFTLGFDAPGVPDERPYAALAARTFGTEHHDLTISARDFRDFLPKYVWHMEEPVCEPPGIALYYVSRLAKDYVKVLIAGEGGDEAFGGYQTYRSVLWLERLKKLIGPARSLVAAGLGQANRALHLGRVAKYGPLVGVPFDRYYYSRTSSPHAFFNEQSHALYTRGFSQAVNHADSIQVVQITSTHRPDST